MTHVMPILDPAPAHNEEAQLADTLHSLHNQTRQPDVVLVVSDNSTDATVDIARSTYPGRVRPQRHEMS